MHCNNASTQHTPVGTCYNVHPFGDNLPLLSFYSSLWKCIHYPAAKHRHAVHIQDQILSRAFVGAEGMSDAELPTIQIFIDS